MLTVEISAEGVQARRSSLATTAAAVATSAMLPRSLCRDAPSAPFSIIVEAKLICPTLRKCCSEDAAQPWLPWLHWHAFYFTATPAMLCSPSPILLLQTLGTHSGSYCACFCRLNDTGRNMDRQPPTRFLQQG